MLWNRFVRSSKKSNFKWHKNLKGGEMSKKKKILGTLGAIVCVGALATTTYFAVPEITNKSWSEMLNIGITKPTPDNPTKEEYSLKISAENVTYICTDTTGKTYTEEELHSKKWNGEELTFVVTVNQNYYISSVKVNGEPVELENNQFNVIIDNNVIIEIETKEIKTYTVDIVEDRYITWQLTKNGEPLSTGDIIQTNDVLGGRVIATTSGYKIGSFLINDQEKVSLLDELGRFEYKVENFESDILKITGTTIRDTSSRVVQITKDYNSNYANVKFVYTSEDYSVYNIANSGLYVGQEIEGTFDLQEGDIVKSITLNNQDLDYSVDNQKVSFYFIVNNQDFTLSIQTEYMLPVQYTINYDESLFELSFDNGEFNGNTLTIARNEVCRMDIKYLGDDVDVSNMFKNGYVLVTYGENSSIFYGASDMYLIFDENVKSNLITIEYVVTNDNPTEPEQRTVDLIYDSSLLSVKSDNAIIEGNSISFEDGIVIQLQVKYIGTDVEVDDNGMLLNYELKLTYDPYGSNYSVYNNYFYIPIQGNYDFSSIVLELIPKEVA